MPGATEPAPRRSLRLWPGVTAGVLLLARLALPRLMPEVASYGFVGGVLAALVILLWWLFLSRAPWVERLAAIGLILIATAGTWRVLHPSIAGAMMGLMFPMRLSRPNANWTPAAQRRASAPSISTAAWKSTRPTC